MRTVDNCKLNGQEHEVQKVFFFTLDLPLSFIYPFQTANGLAPLIKDAMLSYTMPQTLPDVLGPLWSQKSSALGQAL